MATSQVFFFQFLGGAVFIALGETIFSSALRAALQSATLNVDIEAIIAGGPTRVRESVSISDLPGVLHAYNHAITTAYVRNSPFERYKSLTNRYVAVPRRWRDLCRLLCQFWYGVAENSKEREADKESDGL